MIKEKLKKMCLKVSTVAAILMTASTKVFAAATDTQITAKQPADVATKIFSANQGMATAFGGALVGIAVVVIGIKMLMTSKKQEARSEAMDSVLTVIIAALLIGGFAIFGGLIWGWGQ